MTASRQHRLPQIEVTFDIDANGIIDVKAQDKGTGKEQKITITATTKLSKQDIERMVKDSEKFADADRARREKAELKNRAEQKTYEVNRILEEMGDKIPQELKDQITRLAEELKAVIPTDDAAKIKEKLDELDKALLEIGKRVYSAGAAQAGQAPPPPPPGGDDTKGGDDSGVVDADYKIVDDEDKKG